MRAHRPTDDRQQPAAGPGAEPSSTAPKRRNKRARGAGARVGCLVRPQAQGAGMRGSRCCSNAVSFPAAGERLGCPHSRIAFAVCFRGAGWLRQGAVAVMQVHFKVSKMVHRPLGFQQAVAKVTWLGPVAHTNKVCRRRLR